MTSTPYAQKERTFAESENALDQITAKLREHRQANSVLLAEKVAKEVENELIEEAEAAAIADGHVYLGQPPTDISALEAGIKKSERISVKMAELIKVKGKAKADASQALLLIQRQLCFADAKRRGFAARGRVSFEAVANLTIGEVAEIAQLHAWANQSPISLRDTLRLINEPDWKQIDAREKAFAAARREGADGK